MNSGRPAFRLCIAALALACALPLAATAEDRSGPGVADAKDPALAPRLPLVRAVTPARSTAPLRLRTRPASPLTEAEQFTDAGLDRPASSLTARERAKLEAARISVAAARAARGASAPAVRSLDPATPLHSIGDGAAGKLERLRLAQPAALANDPAQRGLPPVLQSRQRQGAQVPSASEREKLKANPTSSVTPEPAKESER